MFKQLLALALITPLLGACVNGPLQNGIKTLVLDPKINDTVQKLGAFTVQDLDNADAIAVKANDSLAHMCFPVLKAFVLTIQARTNGAAGNTVSGAFSAFEAARTAVNGGADLVSKQDVTMLEAACGGLVQDTANTPAKFMAALAGLGG